MELHFLEVCLLWAVGMAGLAGVGMFVYFVWTKIPEGLIVDARGGKDD